MEPRRIRACHPPEPAVMLGRYHDQKVVLMPEGPCARGAHGGGGAWEIDADTFQVLHHERLE